MIERLYRVWLRCCPRPFRERFGEEVLATAREFDRRTDRRGRLAALLDAIRTAVALRSEYRAARRTVFDAPTEVAASGFVRDIRFAWRTVRRTPAFAAFVIVTLALAIGANAALFGIADRLLLSGPAHVREPERVARVYVSVQPTGMRQFTSSGFGHVTLDVVRRQAALAESVAAYAINEGTTGRGVAARETTIGYVSAGFFALLGVAPAHGRFFSGAEDAVEGARRVVVLSDGLWRRQFGAGDVVGQTVAINDTPFTIVGVAPAGFTGAELRPVDFWVPLNLLGPRITSDWTTSWSAQWLHVIIRLKPGATRDAAGEQLTAAFRTAYTGDEPYMRTARLWLADLGANEEGSEPQESVVVRWLSAVAAIVLLIAAANVTNLFLARATTRMREVGVRLALGASRQAVVRMLVIESTLLSLAGGGAGLGVAYLIATVARRSLLDAVDWPSSPINERVMLVTAVTAVAVGAVVGMVPAIGITRSALANSLRTGTRATGGRWMRLPAALTVVQSTLCAALLIGAGLFVRSIWNARHVDLGFDADRVVIVEVNRAAAAQLGPDQQNAERTRRRTFFSTALDGVRSIPGVNQASVAVGLPFGNRFSVRIGLPGMDTLPSVPTGGPSISAVEAAYFSTMGTPILGGRGFTSADRAGSAAVAIISGFTARTLWPNEDPLGRCLLIGDPPGPCATIIGIAGDTHRGRLVEQPRMHVYIPLGQERGFGGAVLLLRSREAVALPLDAVRQVLMDADPTITFVRSETLQSRIDPQLRSWMLGMSTLLFSGTLALIVAGVGIYSLLSCLVADRRKEIGVRMALGARLDQVARMVVRWSVLLAAAGAVIGSALALSASRFLEPLLFQVSPKDPLVFAAVSATLLTVAGIAGLVPGIRAARVDPLEALRVE